MERTAYSRVTTLRHRARLAAEAEATESTIRTRWRWRRSTGPACRMCAWSCSRRSARCGFRLLHQLRKCQGGASSPTRKGGGGAALEDPAPPAAGARAPSARGRARGRMPISPRARSGAGWAPGRRAQSQPLASRSALMAEVARVSRDGKGLTRAAALLGRVPGVAPIEIEFWADGAFRLHDRFVWRRETPEYDWEITRLNP